MKTWMLAAGMTLAGATSCLADGQFWVVGDTATNNCEIVTSNPVLDGFTAFGSGPYKSLDDAKLARSTIGACRKSDPPKG